MRSAVFWRVTAALIALLLAGTCGAASLPEMIQRIKPAVVAIGTYERTRSPAFVFHGTGFAVQDGNLIATNAHVVPTVLDPARLEQLVVMVPARDKPGDAERREARLVRIDRDHDLALLRVSGPPLPALKLAGVRANIEGTSAAFTGFPLGSSLGVIPVTHRATVSALPPLALPTLNARQLEPQIIRRLGQEVFTVLQLDATAYPGNSGSPLWDVETGEVIGVINMVVVKNTRETLLSQPSGMSFALPAEYLQALIDAPAR